MKVWLVSCGKYLGRVLARGQDDALKMAAAHWGRGRSYQVVLYEKEKKSCCHVQR